MLHPTTLPRGHCPNDEPTRKVIMSVGTSSPEDRAAILFAQATSDVARYEEARAELEDLRVTAASPDNSVTVTVRCGGAIEEIRISDDAMRRGSRIVGHLVLSTIQRAKATASTRVAERLRDVMGARMDLAAMVREQIPEELTAEQPDQNTPEPRSGGYGGGYEA